MKLNLDSEIQALLNRFCAREGRHGETYLLEQGIQKGLIRQIKSAFKEWALEMVEEEHTIENQWTAGYNLAKKMIKERIYED